MPGSVASSAVAGAVVEAATDVGETDDPVGVVVAMVDPVLVVGAVVVVVVVVVVVTGTAVTVTRMVLVPPTLERKPLVSNSPTAMSHVPLASGRGVKVAARLAVGA